MSPFVRDVGQILLDDGSALHELWAGMQPPKDESGGGGSGTTSRRHSVSVVQPRMPAVVGGFGNDSLDSTRPIFHPQTFGSRGRLMLSDDDLAADLGSLNIKDGPGPSSSTRLPPHICPHVAQPTYFRSRIPLQVHEPQYSLWLVYFQSPTLWLTQ